MMAPNKILDIMVPNTAKSVIGTILVKNYYFSRLYPASNMIGGRSRRKNAFGSNCKILMNFLDLNMDIMRIPQMSPIMIATTLSGTTWSISILE